MCYLFLPTSFYLLCLSYLGLTICPNAHVNDLYVLEAVTTRPTKYFMLLCSDNKRIRVPIWPCIKLFDSLNSEEEHDIPVPFKCLEIKSFLQCISSAAQFEVRVHNATLNFPEYADIIKESSSIAQLAFISKVAAFFMANRVLHECCLKICEIIREEQTSGGAASFKTYVKHK